MPAQLLPAFVQDRAVVRLEAMPPEERAVIVAGEEAGLLTLAPAGHGEACPRGFGPGLGLRVHAERKRDPVQLRGVEPREHVGLILLRVRSSREQAPAPVVDDPGVVPRRQLLGPGAPCERKQVREAKRAVARNAGIGRLATLVAAHERSDNGAAKRLAQVERDVRDAEPVTRRPRRQDSLGGATGAFSIRPLRVEPEPKRDSDRVRKRLEQRNGGVHPARHRHCGPSRCERRPKSRPDRVRQRIDRERLAADRSSLEQVHPDQRLGKSLSVGIDDPIAINM